MSDNFWLSTFHPNPEATMKMFCFSYAGGGTRPFRRWFQHLPDWLELHAIRLPGREERLDEPAYTALSPLIEELLRQLTRYFDKPFVFFGHSMGALVAFNFVLALRRAQLPLPKQLFISSFRAPHRSHTTTNYHQLPDEELIEKLDILRATPRWILRDARAMRQFLPTFRADLTLCETYLFDQSPPLDIPIHVFGGEDDILVDEEELYHWKHHTTADFSVSLFPGGHFYLHSKSRVSLLKKIRSLLIQEDGRAS